MSEENTIEKKHTCCGGKNRGTDKCDGTGPGHNHHHEGGKCCGHGAGHHHGHGKCCGSTKSAEGENA